MNAFIVFSALLATALSMPLEQGVAVTQDTVGNYNLRLITNDVQRTEEAFKDGKVTGSYSFVHPNGFLHTINYVADPLRGFVATGTVPEPVKDTPEVAASKAAHLAIVAQERASLPFLPEAQYVEEIPAPVVAPAPIFSLPVQSLPVQAAPKLVYIDNTAELEAAKAQHFAAHQQALARLAEEYRKIA